jgi:hypothetical protein
MTSSQADRELATILAALRYWQREGLSSAGHEQDIASNGYRFEALSEQEIDTLCERLNFEGSEPSSSDPAAGRRNPRR